MILDTSALLAVLLNEAEAALFSRAMAQSDPLRMSAANWFEASMVAEGRLSSAYRQSFDRLITRFSVRIEPVTAEHARIARIAWREFGRGNHPARLNFGDCFAYGLAKATGEPLLFKGNDFSQTDIEPALKA